MHADGQTPVDGARAVFVHGGPVGRGLRRVVRVLGAFRDGCAVDEGDLLVKQRGIAAGFDVVRAGVG